jgi:hypothetical protein
MAYFTRHVVNLTMDTSTAGTATAYTDEPVNGYVHAIRYVHSTSGGLSTTCHLKVSGENSGIPVIGVVPDFTGTGESKTYYPRVDVCNSSGDFNIYDDTSTMETRRVKDRAALALERVKFEVTTSSSTGDNTGSGTFHVLVGG